MKITGKTLRNEENTRKNENHQEYAQEWREYAKKRKSPGIRSGIIRNTLAWVKTHFVFIYPKRDRETSIFENNKIDKKKSQHNALHHGIFWDEHFRLLQHRHRLRGVARCAISVIVSANTLPGSILQCLRLSLNILSQFLSSAFHLRLISISRQLANWVSGCSWVTLELYITFKSVMQYVPELWFAMH